MTPISTTRLRITGIALAAALLLALLAAWRADRRDRTQLAADLTAANQSLTQASARQRARNAQLQQALGAIEVQKRTVTKPAQILQELPKEIPLPAPVTLETQSPSANLATPPCSSGLPGFGRPEGLDAAPPGTPPVMDAAVVVGASLSRRPLPSGNAAGQAVLPVADLKPIYDFALDCHACQAKLAAAQADLVDERAKSATLTHERDDAVQVAKGGSALRRFARAAKWFLVGAAVGAAASRAAH